MSMNILETYQFIDESWKQIFIKHNNFITKLISCPYCLGFWMSCFICFFSYDLFFVYYVYILLYSTLLLIIDSNGIRN